MSHAQLHGDDEHLRRLFDRVEAGIAIAASDGRFLYVNPRFCTTVGYSAAELASMDFLQLTHPDDRARNLALVGELLAGERDSFTLDKRYLAKDREPVWVRANVAALRDDDGETQLIATTEDVTGQKTVEARLEQSQTLLRIAGEVGRVGGWAIDADPIRLYWSDEIHDLAGYPRGETPPLQEALELYPLPDRDAMQACVERCLADGTPFDLEARFSPRGGEDRWVRVVGEPRWDATGSRVDRIQGAIMDISEQKRAQEETRQLAERLTATMESITDALYTIDTEWRFTYLNRRAQEVLERDADDVIGRSIWEAFPAVVGTPLQATYERAVARRQTTVLEEYHYTPLDRYFNVHAYPSEQGLAVYFSDVTAKRATRLELEKRGARLEQQAALLDEAQDAIVVRDLDDRITFWNRSAERIYGWRSDEVMGRPINDLLAIDATVHEAAKRALFTRGSWVSEVTKRDRQGRELIVEARWTLVRDDDGAPASILEIDTDITQRKQIEMQFLRSQRMESIGKLAGGVAHDLNNALSPIQISIGLLREDETDPSKLRILDIIATSASRGADMVEQVLSFARGVDGSREAIAVDAVVEEVRRICSDTFPKNIRIESDLPADLWTVIGDATQLQQVLVNLSVNARDAMPHGGTITLSAANVGTHGGDGDLSESEGQPSVVLRVADTGAGISDEVASQMFDPFFSTKPPSEGTGLGLSTSVVIVESHGGSIEVSTELGVGTTFSIQLPADPASVDADGPSAGALPRGEGELILVVDDEPGIRDMTRLMLERSGYEVSTAADGSEAAAALDREGDRLALVVTDIMMPEMDGYELISRIRGRGSKVPIIAISGLSTPETADRALGAGASRFLAKPFDQERLLRATRDALDAADERELRPA